MPVSKICEHCNKEFSVSPRRHETVKFCSRDCKTAHGWIELSCANCGKPFQRRRGDTTRNISGNHYCSKQCEGASMIGKPSKNQSRKKTFSKCESCGTRFQITSTRKETARWCSITCKRESPEWKRECSERMQGEKHWRWTGGVYKSGCGYVRTKSKKLTSEKYRLLHRLIVLEQMMVACPDHPFIVEIDGEKRLSPEVEVHHIDRDRSNNDISNLLAVTKHAHAQIHHRNKKPNPWECWPSNPLAW